MLNALIKVLLLPFTLIEINMKLHQHPNVFVRLFAIVYTLFLFFLVSVVWKAIFK